MDYYPVYSVPICNIVCDQPLSVRVIFVPSQVNPLPVDYVVVRGAAIRTRAFWHAWFGELSPNLFCLLVCQIEGDLVVVIVHGVVSNPHFNSRSLIVFLRQCNNDSTACIRCEPSVIVELVLGDGYIIA